MSDDLLAQENGGRRRASQGPDLIDALIIVLTSAAAVIFIFWLAYQTLHLDIVVPDFIKNAFSAIWRAAAAGTAGIGLAIYKAVTRNKNEPHPNYLIWIGLCTGAFLAFIFAVYWLLGPKSRASENGPSEAVNDLKTAIIGLDCRYEGLSEPYEPVASDVLEQARRLGNAMQNITDADLDRGDQIQKYSFAGEAFIIGAEIQAEIERASGSEDAKLAAEQLDKAAALIAQARLANNGKDAYAKSLVEWVDRDNYENMVRYYQAIALAVRAKAGEKVSWAQLEAALRRIGPGYLAATPIRKNPSLDWACTNLLDATKSSLCQVRRAAT